MIIQVRYHTTSMYYYDMVGYSSSDVISSALVSLKANIVLVFYCLQVAVMPLIVDWDGLPV